MSDKGRKKYEFTGETIYISKGKKLRQIRYLIPLVFITHIVNPGDIGGWIEKEENLSHEGNAWIDQTSMVMGNAFVGDCAVVCGASMIDDHAQVLENAVVTGKSQVFDRAIVRGNAVITGMSAVGGDMIIKGKVTLSGGTLATGKKGAVISGYDL